MATAVGKVALVTGAASGIGRACAIALAGEGAQVIVADIDPAGAQETCRLVAEGGSEAVFQRLDVSSEADWATALDAVRRSHGALHVLVNNAAICIAAPLLEMSFEPGSGKTGSTWTGCSWGPKR